MLALWEVYFSRKISMAFSPVAQLDIQLGGGDGKGYYCARSAKKNVLPQPLTFLGRGGYIFQIFEKTSYFWNSITSMDPY